MGVFLDTIKIPTNTYKKLLIRKAVGMCKIKGFTLIELLVVISIIALLMSILMPALARVKEQARTIGCLANLKQWGLISAMYTQDNDGKFWSGLHYGLGGTDSGKTGLWWPWQLEDRLKDWKANKIWFCPTAKKPITDENGKSAATLNIFNAWGIFTGSRTCSITGKTYEAGPNGMAGSYTINGYVLDIPSNAKFERRNVPAKDGWTANVSGAANVPVFVDSLRFDTWPIETCEAANNEFAPWADDMARCCINRHDGYVSSVFLDFSARKVGLKELWTLKWHRTFNTAGYWTVAGGVEAGDWPEWIRPFRDY